ncbi:hypothetical protein L593_03490 [Salinarchaeum sp. Harcht-Bsk1]|uniref:DUF3179 domain-containing protein n=1 Tax=Salinarchaeum sp. Harcht-Bsk1 TaxID=1333523 RepID=UPI0003422834|nr:DUF3179 domain-containing protein [Salinarchaeum sp. Harcht-Bsk1]AGN00649.1 hypothetical protein L593_03490 [Salinarchaeum sp. Harcht-Bsk1]
MPSRRTVLEAIAGLATAGAVGLAGCLEQGGSADPPSSDPDAAVGPSPPTAERNLPRAYSMQELRDAVLNGGVSQDGIPSIDDPSFESPNSAGLDDGDPVFGVERNGEAKAYPQRVLVHHEIVNDRLGDEPVAITYCPLTGTVQGFRRGDTEFGVSGNLLNDNLVMYDRATESWWPQILATAIAGDHVGHELQEFEVTWTTFGRWTGAHPDTAILSEDTGYVRDYGDDPYGEYNPKDAYYQNRGIFFDVTNEDDRLHPKTVVMGARTADGALAIEKEAIRSAGVRETTVGGTPFVAVYEPSLDTAVVYRNAEDRDLGHDGERPTVDGEAFDPESLPLERVISFDAMWFAWAADYPNTALVTA